MRMTPTDTPTICPKMSLLPAAVSCTTSVVMEVMEKGELSHPFHAGVTKFLAGSRLVNGVIQWQGGNYKRTMQLQNVVPNVCSFGHSTHDDGCTCVIDGSVAIVACHVKQCHVFKSLHGGIMAIFSFV